MQHNRISPDRSAFIWLIMRFPNSSTTINSSGLKRKRCVVPLIARLGCEPAPGDQELTLLV